MRTRAISPPRCGSFATLCHWQRSEQLRRFVILSEGSAVDVLRLRLRTGATLRMTVALSAVALALIFSALPVSANRFGYPWMGQVSAEQTTVYRAPDRTSPIGPLGRGAFVAVVGGQDQMFQTPDGWVPASDVVESIQPCVAEVADQTVALYAKPRSEEHTSELQSHSF